MTTIRQRNESFKCFDKVWVDPKTNQPYLDDNEAPKHSIPNHLWEKNPVKASVTLNDDHGIQLTKTCHDNHQIWYKINYVGITTKRTKWPWTMASAPLKPAPSKDHLNTMAVWASPKTLMQPGCWNIWQKNHLPANSRAKTTDIHLEQWWYRLVPTQRPW